MIGPRDEKVIKKVCRGCDQVIFKKLGGTKRFPKKRTVYYCTHLNLNSEVLFIRKYPNTPKWCPVLLSKSKQMKKKLRKLIHNKYNGRCAYCGTKIDFSEMQVDHYWPKLLAHIQPDLNNNGFENLMPSCANSA